MKNLKKMGDMLLISLKYENNDLMDIARQNIAVLENDIRNYKFENKQIREILYKRR